MLPTVKDRTIVGTTPTYAICIKECKGYKTNHLYQYFIHAQTEYYDDHTYHVPSNDNLGYWFSLKGFKIHFRRFI